MRNVYSQEQKQFARKLLNEGYTMKNVADHAAIKYQTVVNIRKELGITGDANAVDWSDAATYFQNGVALQLDKDIAAAKGCSVGSVYQYRRKNGIKACRRANGAKQKLAELKGLAQKAVDEYFGTYGVRTEESVDSAIRALRNFLQKDGENGQS